MKPMILTIVWLFEIHLGKVKWSPNVQASYSLPRTMKLPIPKEDTWKFKGVLVGGWTTHLQKLTMLVHPRSYSPIGHLPKLLLGEPPGCEVPSDLQQNQNIPSTSHDIPCHLLQIEAVNSHRAFSAQSIRRFSVNLFEKPSRKIRFDLSKSHGIWTPLMDNVLLVSAIVNIHEYSIP